jgi:hypothetical protein
MDLSGVLFIMIGGCSKTERLMVGPHDCSAIAAEPSPPIQMTFEITPEN